MDNDDFSLRMHRGESPETICADMAKIVLAALHAHQGELGYWEKLWASHAINGMSTSLAADKKDDMGLQVTLLALEKLHAAQEDRDISQFKLNPEVEAVSKEGLLKLLDVLAAPAIVKKRVISLRSV